MDAGGTTAKVAALDTEGNLLTNIKTHPSYSKKSYQNILKHFAELIYHTCNKVKDDFKLVGVTIGFPGPFDYEKGISYMQGMDKYDSLYQKSFKDDLYKKISENTAINQASPLQISFANDAVLFALGAYSKLDVKGKMIAITIGTGCGSTFIDAGEIAVGKGGVPKDGMIYHLPFKDSIIDDYISKRGIKTIAKFHGYTDIDIDIAELNKSASRGDKKAIGVFRSFGIDLKDALEGVILSYKPNAIVFGGQISKAYEHFGEPIAGFAMKHGIKIIVDTDSSRNVMKGAVGLIKKYDTTHELKILA